MDKKDVLKKIKTLLGVEVKLEQMKLDNGTVLEADAFEPEQAVFVISGEDKIPLPIGDYTLEDGKVLVVAQDGVIGEIKETVEEAPTEEAPKEIPIDAEAAPTAPKKVIESISKELFFSEIEKLRNEIKELQLSKDEKEVELKKDDIKEVELSEVKPIVHNPEKISKQKQTFYKKESLVEFLNNKK